MGIRPDDWQIGAIPVSHSYALGNIVAPLLLQGTPVVLRDAFVPAQILDDAVRVGARLFAGVPFMFDRLVGAGPRRLAVAGHAADADLGRRAARSRDGARPSPNTPAGASTRSTARARRAASPTTPSPIPTAT